MILVILLIYHLLFSKASNCSIILSILETSMFSPPPDVGKFAARNITSHVIPSKNIPACIGSHDTLQPLHPLTEIATKICTLAIAVIIVSTMSFNQLKFFSSILHMTSLAPLFFFFRNFQYSEYIPVLTLKSSGF